MAKKVKKETEEKVLEKDEKIVEEFTTKTKEKKEKKQKEHKDGYFKLLRGQLKMVKWPSGKEMFKYTFSTIIFILLFVLFFQLIDVISSFVKGLF